MREDVDTPEQDVDMLSPENELSFLRLDEAVFHCMGDSNNGIESDDARSSLERVRRAHQRLDRFRRGRAFLERHQAGRKRGDLALSFHAKELHQRKAAQITAHCLRLRMAVKTR